ncbi:MAG: hypothetical protein L0Z54_03730 [Thermoplasmata archaeon]|nr:hypothetical protein [Thermoplasmata archaeon]
MVELDEVYLRRASHTVGACAVLYYALPESIYGVPRWTVPMIAVMLSTAGESFRLRRGALVPGLRDHERGRVASYYQFGLSMVLLVLLFPQAIAVPCLLVAALVDPLLGEMRGRRGSCSAAMLLCVAIFIAAGYRAEHWALIAAGSVAAVALEMTSRPPLDDDVTVPIGTGLLLWAMSLMVDLPSGVIEPVKGALL